MDRNNSVKNNSVNNNSQNTFRRARGAAAMLCAVFAGLGLAGRAAAQEPQTHSPAIPTPYQSPLFHGGGSDPALALPSPPFGVDPLLLNPLYSQLQGTPTELVGVTSGAGPNAVTNYYPVQIPSFDLGDYDPNRPPGLGGTANPGQYYPDHLADGSIYSWQAPFDYVPLSTGMVVVDDTSPAPTAATGTTPGTSGFAFNPSPGNWQQQTTGPAAGTATGGEYYRLPPNTGGGNGNGTAIWTLVATTAGSYSVYFHIPDQVQDSNGQIEARSTQVTYQIAVSGANALTTTATVSQTEANSSQFLAGPFTLAVGDTVTVTLQRDNSHNQNTNNDANGNADYLIADSMTLQTAIGDVQSTPTAINASAYPADFARLKYWGIYATPGTGGVPATGSGTTPIVNAPPDTTGTITPNGTPLFRYGDPNLTKSDAGTLDGPLNNGTPHIRLIRQVVYFGRQEPSVSAGLTVDDNSAAPATGRPGFTASGWSQVNNTAVNATNDEYKRRVPVKQTNSPQYATWTFIAPNGGDFYATVHLPLTPSGESRIPDATYTVTYPTGSQTVQISQAQTGDVTLPTGAIPLLKGDVVTIALADTTTKVTNPNGYFIVADSARIESGGANTGAIYCVDGFTGGVIWRFQTPGGLNGPSAPVFSAPVVTKINVLVTPAGPGGTPAAVYANKLVVIVGDNNGMVYCLDAVGYGDGTSNANVIDPTTGLPIYIPQPTYGTTTPPLQVDAPGYLDANGLGHVGTTNVYWVYRPDPNRPKYVTGTGIGTVKRDARGDILLDPNSDLPVPAAFGTASPNVFVDPSVSTTPDANGVLASNAKVYIGNSNGVLYALDALGVPIDGTSLATYEMTGDRFNASYDLRQAPNVFPAVTTDAIVPTPQPLWWFTLRGADPNSTANTSSADIESAPAIHTTVTTTSVTDTNGNVTMTNTYAPTVYIGSAHEVEATSNVGRLYALNGTYGPAGNNGLAISDPAATPGSGQYHGIPGGLNYNVAQRPQTSNTDAADWSFPDAYDRTTNNATKNNQGQSSNKLPRPALGNVTGSPVVFTDTNETDPTRRTRIYFAANVGLEVPAGSRTGTAASVRPDDTLTGRIWAVNLDGSVGRTTNSTGTANSTVWSYPLANDPNNAALDKTAEPTAPMGSFLHGTPAMGFVQFPSNIVGYPTLPSDHFHTSLLGQSVPMLYIATRGVNDTALYAVDVDGDTDTQRLVYRQVSPDGSIFQSSPALVTNSSTTNSGGNGGAVYVVSDNTLYDFSATPISNPGIIDPATGVVDYPLIRENKAYTGFGPISSPTLSAGRTTDLLTPTELTTYTAATGFNETESDWIYVGDSSTGFCRGITPFDASDAGIPSNLGFLVPPTVDQPGAVDLQAIMQVYLVSAANSGSVSATDAYPVGPNAALPVYDWGQNVYIRFKNVAPPPDPSGNTANDKIVEDSNASAANGPIQGYGRGGPIEFDISDAPAGTAGTPATPPDHGTVPAVFLPAGNTPLGNGFIPRKSGEKDPGANISLVDSVSGTGYIGAYTYAISDGTARRNTPGSRRHILNAKQTVEVYLFTGGSWVDQHRTAVLAVQTTAGNEVSTPNPSGTPPFSLTPVQPVDEPTFAILNPLAVRAGGIPLQLNPGTTPAYAIPIGDTAGPFRGVGPTVAKTPNDPADLEALANGNDIPQAAPPSSSGGGSPIKRPAADLTDTTLLTTTHVVVTSTGLIRHNDSGDNFDQPGANALLPPHVINGANEGLFQDQNDNPTSAFGSVSMPYAMDLTDRSALGLRRTSSGAATRRLRVKTGTISGGGSGLYWNDNSIPTQGHDHDSVVNFLPWEAAPVGYKNGANPSTDYPDISTSNISATLHPYDGGAQDMTLGQAIAKPADDTKLGTDDIKNREVYANPVQFHISIPHFQPANQQLYLQNSAGGYTPADEITPTSNAFGPGDNIFPMGYVTTRRIYVPDQNGLYQPGAAYRDVRVYTGVPPDYSTQMADSTVSIPQTLPSSFGAQTSQFNGLQGPSGTVNVNTFDPFNPMFQALTGQPATQGYFQPLTIYNTGNVNLLNVHLDQKQQINTAPPFSLLLSSDALDPLSFIPGFDYFGVTGPRGTLPGTSVTELPFLVRSSLDTDLIAAYGRNPYITRAGNTDALGQPLSQVYPGATFHKAQVGSGQPTTLYVPDSPEGFTPGASLDVSPTNLPTHVTDGNNGSLPFKTPPYVSVAVPFGTPVGSYHGTLQAFEGLDPTGYSDVAKATYPASVAQGPLAQSGPFAGLTTQIFPPHYGGVVGGLGEPGAALPDTIEVAQAGTDANGNPNPPVTVMPASTTTTVLNARIVEARMTDGATYGAVPQVDQGPAIPATTGANGTPARSTPDFAPAAFRDPVSGNLSIYWTSGRTPTNSTSPFNVWAANVPFTLNPSGNTTRQGYFLPSDPTQYWWKPFAPLTGGNGTNSGLTIAQDTLDLSGGIYAFMVNVQPPSQSGPYQNTLLAYSVTPGTGALVGGVAITNDPSQVKYGVKGLVANANTKFNRSLWAFWTATTRGRTSIYYNSADPSNNTWIPATGPGTTGLLPVPAGLTAVADPAPLIVYGNVLVNGAYTSEATIEVTYSGTAPDGSIDLYQSRYQPDIQTASQLDLVPYPNVTEVLRPTGQGWYQARDVAWSRTSPLNLYVNQDKDPSHIGIPILYDTTGKPLFSRAVFDKASGLLVLTGVPSTINGTTYFTLPANAPTTTTVTAYIDLATGRVRFSLTPSVQVAAYFSPLARRITEDSRADTGPVTFLDGNPKLNAAAPYLTNGVIPDRRWYIWRKAAAGGAASPASIYYKTQRLTVFLRHSIGVSIPAAGSAPALLLTSVTVNGTNVTQYVDVDYSRGRIYFPINANGTSTEGQSVTVTYAPSNTVSTANPSGTTETDTDTIQWQDEEHASGDVPPTDTAAGLNAVTDTLLPISQTINESNVSAFLDTEAYSNKLSPLDLTHPHKVWVFWNSTRNGTADLYYETINPLFSAGP